MTTPGAAPRSKQPLSPAGWIVTVLAGALTLGFCIVHWPAWRNNPDLSHGLFAPALFVLLLRESRRRGPWRFPADTAALRWLRAGALVAGLGFVVLAGLFAAAVEWSHPLVGQSLAFALSGMLLGALLWLSSDKVRAIPLNWPSLLAVGFWPFCAPLPPGTYSRITLQLQFWVTDIVLGALHLVGIPASTSGNIILLAHTSVGVEEACSGVRSLLSCVVAALFFSAVLVRRPWARVVLIALAPLLAFGMNIVRSLTLTLLANRGVDIGGKWHDLTGFAVLGVTATLLGALALWLEEKDAPFAPANTDAPGSEDTSRKSPRVWDVIGTYLAVCGFVVFFAVNTHGPTRPASNPPDMQALLPVRHPDWDSVLTEDLYQFASILETDHLVQRTYLRRGDTSSRSPVQITVYLAYWAPGQVPVSLVATHTPDACWPGTGWKLQPVTKPEAPFMSGERPLTPPEYREFTNGSARQNVWYWHLYEGTSLTHKDPRSARALLKLAWTHGFRTAGEQMFVRISSNRPWSEICDEPLLVDILARLEAFGLRASSAQ